MFATLDEIIKDLGDLLELKRKNDVRANFNDANS